MVELVTPRLRLRPACTGDLEAIHEVLSDARATRYWSTPPHARVDETAEWLGSMIAIELAEGEDFVVEYDGRVIGKAGFHRFPVIGFILRPDCWGKGLAREALQAVIARAFAVHRLPAITADVDPGNQASLGLLARLGFWETGRATRTWNLGGTWCDSVYLRLEPPS